MRKLASIQTITDILPIEGADRIELAHVLGWQCVVNKGQFKPGDDAVYFEIDSFLPIRPEYEFLRNSSYKNSELLGEGFRLKTQKFRGEISQGLLLPVTILDGTGYHGLPVGTDVTEILGVKKWEIPETATSGGTVIGELPKDVPHTDETRVQACPELIEEFRGLPFYITTKMDGTSSSVSIDENGFHVTGHNFEYKDDGKCSFYTLVKKLDVEANMRDYMRKNDIKTLTIQGELCAPGIQSNRLKLNEPHWYVFTVRVDGRRIGLHDMLNICRILELETVPVEDVITASDLPTSFPDIESLLKRADGEYPNGGKKEGIVIRPIEPVYSKLLNGSLSMKVINNKYLLKNKD